MGVKETLLGTNDRHWTPVYLQCNLCHTSFQFILTLETLQQDEAAMFSYFNISNKLHHRTSNRWNEKKEIFQNKIFFRNPIQINKVVRKNCGNKTKYIFLLFRICYGHITELSVWLIYFSCKPFIKRISISLDTNLPTYLDYYQQFGITQLGRKI